MTNFLTIKDISIPRAFSVLLTTLKGLHFYTLIVNIFKLLEGRTNVWVDGCHILVFPQFLCQL